MFPNGKCKQLMDLGGKVCSSLYYSCNFPESVKKLKVPKTKMKEQREKKIFQWLLISLKNEWILTKSLQWTRWSYIFKLQSHHLQLLCWLPPPQHCPLKPLLLFSSDRPGMLPLRAFLPVSPSAWSVLPPGFPVACTITSYISPS